MPMPERSRLLRAAGVAAVVLGLLLTGYGLGQRTAGDERPWSAVHAAEPAGPSAVDIGFAQDMTVHHQQAVEMATAALTGTTNPAVTTLARSILVSQSKEIGILQGWLSLWDAPMLPAGPPMVWMKDAAHDHSGASAGGMPGMATMNQMERLRAARGPAFDRLFLRLMIRHHRGGVPMADAAVRSARLAAVRSLAGLMSYEQQQEIAAMQAQLAAS